LHDCKCGYITIFFSKNSGHHPLGFVKYSNNTLELSVKSFKQGTGSLRLLPISQTRRQVFITLFKGVQNWILDIGVKAIWCQVVNKLRVLALRESSNKRWRSKAKARLKMSLVALRALTLGERERNNKR